jgi:hypothetical protein
MEFMNSFDSPPKKALFKAKVQEGSSLTVQKAQVIQKKKQEEWELEAETNQRKQNTKNYLNLTKEFIEQGKAITALNARVQELESRFQQLEKKNGRWQSYTIGICLILAVVLLID